MAALAYRFNMSCIVMLMLIWLTNPLFHTSHRTIDGPAFTRRPPYGALPVLPLSNRHHSLTLPQHFQTTWVFVANNFPPIASSCQLHHSSIRTTSWHRTFLPSPNKPARPVRCLPFTILELQTAKLAHLFLSRQANPADTRQLPSNAQFAKRVCAFPPSPSSNVRRVRYHLQITYPLWATTSTIACVYTSVWCHLGKSNSKLNAFVSSSTGHIYFLLDAYDHK
jgi:hypothetical protein